jgi:hypothetical protein
MPTPQSSLIIKQYESFGGNFVDSDYLAAAYETGKPAVLEGTLMRVFSSSSRFFSLKPFLSLTGAKSQGGKEIDSDVFKWHLQGAEYKAARVIENVESSNTTPGLNLTTFRIKLDLDYYQHPDVLTAPDNEYPLQIVDGPIPDGNGYLYTVKIVTDNPQLYLDPQYLQPGNEYCKVSTHAPSEYNQWFGTQQAPNTFVLQSQIGTFAQAIHVTDKAWRDQGKLGMEFTHTDYAGNTSTVRNFMPFYEAVMVDELYNSIEWALMYGKKSTMAGPDKYVTRTGPGIREQLKDSWNQYYSGALSVTLLQDYLMSIFFGRTDETSRAVTCMTGTLGANLFHAALASVANGFLTVDTHYVRQIPSDTSTPWLAYGAEFRKYTGPSGITVNILLNPFYDNLRYCKLFHPQYPQYPIDSARMTFLDFEGKGIDGNIMLLKEKNSFYYGVQEGMLGPSGPITNGGKFGSLKAGYDVAIQASAGVVIKDVTRCGELILSFEN